MQCSLEQLSCEPHGWRTPPVCHPALTPGNQQGWGKGEHSWALPVNGIHEKAYTFRFEKFAKGNLPFIDKGCYEPSDSWLQLYHLLRVAVDKEVQIINIVMKKVAWLSQDWLKGSLGLMKGKLTLDRLLRLSQETCSFKL